MYLTRVIGFLLIKVITTRVVYLATISHSAELPNQRSFATSVHWRLLFKRYVKKSIVLIRENRKHGWNNFVLLSPVLEKIGEGILIFYFGVANVESDTS